MFKLEVEDYMFNHIKVDKKRFALRIGALDFIIEKGITEFSEDAISDNFIEQMYVEDNYIFYGDEIYLCVSDLETVFGHIPNRIYYA